MNVEQDGRLSYSTFHTKHTMLRSNDPPFESCKSKQCTSTLLHSKVKEWRGTDVLHCADFLLLVCSGLSIQRALFLLTLDMWVVEEENDCAYCLCTLRKVPFEREYVDDFPEHH